MGGPCISFAVCDDKFVKGETAGSETIPGLTLYGRPSMLSATRIANRLTKRSGVVSGYRPCHGVCLGPLGLTGPGEPKQAAIHESQAGRSVKARERNLS